MVNYVDTECKQLINRMKESLFTIRTYSIRLSANLYSGCIFDCPYCYAPYIHKFNKNATPEEFGTKIFIKNNAVKVLDTQIVKMKRHQHFRYEYVDLGTITDCYQPIEVKYKLTRQAIERLAAHDIPITILTKSDLVVRDIDILQPLGEQNKAAVGISITTPSGIGARYKSFLEPNSPTTKRRLEAIKKLRKAGIATYVFVNPVVPYLSADEQLIRELFKEIADTGNTSIFFGVMKLNPLTWSLFRKRLQQYDAALVEPMYNLYIKEGEKEFGRSWIPAYSYREQLYTMARDIAREEGVGFSCEGGLYHLWLNDWAEVEQGFNYPTGYNLWSILRRRKDQAVSYADVCAELEATYSTLRPDYFAALHEFWNQGKLFGDLVDVSKQSIDGSTYYQYVGEC